MADEPREPDRLDDLGRRIRAAREAQQPDRGDVGEEYKAGTVAWRMVTELVVGVMVGGAMGWGLDSLFGTLPIFLIVMGMFGFAAGVRTMMRSAEEIRQKQAAGGRHPGAGEANGPRDSGRNGGAGSGGRRRAR